MDLFLIQPDRRRYRLLHFGDLDGTSRGLRLGGGIIFRFGR
jgi:hypothetical protein